jgi:hypothetical protein
VYKVGYTFHYKGNVRTRHFFGLRSAGAATSKFRDETLAVNADAFVVRAAMDGVQDRSALAAALDAEEQKSWRKC